MATRRLLILMLAVLAVSTLGAALLAPQPGKPPPAATTTAKGDGTATRQRPGRLIEASVQTQSPHPEPIRLRPGDQLELTVRSATPGQIEIPRFGLLEDAGPDQPAHFSLVADEPGSFPVRLAGTQRAVARVVVSPTRKRHRTRHGAVPGWGGSST